MRTLAAQLQLDAVPSMPADAESLPGIGLAVVAACAAAAVLAAVAALCAKTEPRHHAPLGPRNPNTAKVTLPAQPPQPQPQPPQPRVSANASPAHMPLVATARADKVPTDSDAAHTSTSVSAGARSSTYDAVASQPLALAAQKPAGSLRHISSSVGNAHVYTLDSGVNLTAITGTNCSDSHAGDFDDTLTAHAPRPPMPLVSLAEHMRCNASDRVLQSRDETVEAVCVMLRDVCDRMEGMMSGSHMLHRHTIREGIYAAIAEATANGVTYTVLFFPDGRRYNRQLRSYDRRWLVDFMPNKAMHTPGGPFTHKRTTVMLPPHILVDRCATMADTLAEARTPQQATSEIFMICIQLYHQIYAFHRRDKVIRDLSVQNVVSTLAGAQRRWTLLEYCAVAGVGADSSSVPVRCTPPEHAEAQMALKPLRMHPSYDVWQLGLMIYDARFGPYWPRDATDASILHKLATPSARLPHEADALDACNIKDMLQVIMKRVPAERPTAEQLRKVLEDHDASGTVGSFTSPWLEALHRSQK